ncbi:hypothetical protein Dimus_034556 [Dionaea muscipula]
MRAELPMMTHANNEAAERAFELRAPSGFTWSNERLMERWHVIHDEDSLPFLVHTKPESSDSDSDQSVISRVFVPVAPMEEGEALRISPDVMTSSVQAYVHDPIPASSPVLPVLSPAQVKAGIPLSFGSNQFQPDERLDSNTVCEAAEPSSDHESAGTLHTELDIATNLQK